MEITSNAGRAALLVAALVGCTSTVRASVGPNPIWTVEEDPVALRRRLAAREAERRAASEAECGAFTRELEAASGGTPTLPPEIGEALALAEPLVLAGLARPDWERSWPTLVRRVIDTSDAVEGPPPSVNAWFRVESVWHELLLRDRRRARTLVLRDRMRRCRAEGRTCDGCDVHTLSRSELTPISSEDARRASRLLYRGADGHLDPHVPLMLAWVREPEAAIAALDSVATADATEALRRPALLLAARAAIERGDPDAAMLRLRRLRAVEPPQRAPDPAADLLLGMLHLLAGRAVDAREALARAAGEAPVGAAGEAARRLLAAPSATSPEPPRTRP